jgi:hypothetical protein
MLDALTAWLVLLTNYALRCLGTAYSRLRGTRSFNYCHIHHQEEPWRGDTLECCLLEHRPLDLR